MEMHLKDLACLARKNKKEPATSEQQAWQQLWEMVGLINERQIMTEAEESNTYQL